MLAITDILEAARALLTEQFPDIPPERFHTNLVPASFQRPAALVTYGTMRMEDASAAAVSVVLPLVIELFEPVDAFHNTHFEALARRMQSVMALFAVEGLRVPGPDRDRVLRVMGTEGECNFDFAQVIVTLNYQDNRPAQEEHYPLMGEVYTNLKEE